MLLTTNIVRNAAARFMQSKATQKKNRKERFQLGISALDSMGAGVSVGFDAFILACAILFFMLELMLLVIAIVVALKCTATVTERVVHLTMAVVFTLPYMLGMVLLNPCAQAVLANRAVPLGTAQISAIGFGKNPL